MKIAATFGASQCPKESPLYREGIELGRLLAQKGYLVKCGGYGGLMEAVSRGVREGGGECVGIVLEAFEAIRPQNPYLSKKIIAKTLYERLELLIEGSLLCIAQEGSVGTLNEVFMAAALRSANLRPDLRIILLGRAYEEFAKCPMIDEKFLQSVEIYADIAQLYDKI